MNRYTIIQEIITATQAHTYLEIGVNDGLVFFNITAPRKIAVDPQFKFARKRRLRSKPLINRLFHKSTESFFEKPSDDFFTSDQSVFLSHKIDVAFVDGLHTYGQAYHDILNCLKFANPNIVIIVHDCNPPAASFAVPAIHDIGDVISRGNKGEIPGWTGHWNGDVWKAIVRLRSERDDLGIYTLDIDWGLAIIFKEKPASRLTFSTVDIEKMDYKDLDKNREQFLNLKEPGFLKNIIEKLKASHSSI